jgi:SAM-dependent methyltransferase
MGFMREVLRRLLKGGATRGGGEALPLPPPEMRALVGLTDPAQFDNPSGGLVYPYLEPRAYEKVFDFGCGCGRVARQLIQQRPRPDRYVGVDLHRGMIEWCRANLAPNAPGFEFHHHDVYNVGFNPGPDKPATAPLPAADHEFTLVNAWSVFTHLTQPQTEHYMREVARILNPEGVLNSTWFLFDKDAFPMMQTFQNALYINDVDLSNAVIYDRSWLRQTAGDAGLTIVRAVPPKTRGFHWFIVLAPTRDGIQEVELPPDTAPFGREPPPVSHIDASRIGLDD